jgi:hypothetical protein
MPGFDGTGPRGQGPMTGGGQGYCMTPKHNFQSRPWGFRGFGRGWKNRYFAKGIPGGFWGRGFREIEPDISAKDKVEMLQDEANYYEREPKNIREEIDRLQKSDSEEQR